MCKRGGLLVAYDTPARRALITDADCDSWNCPECAGRMAANWRQRARMGAYRIVEAKDTLDFITLTSHETLRTFSQSYWVWKRAWALLYASIKRKKQDFCYLLIPERHKDGTLHVHAIWNASVSERWLKTAARRRGLGYMVDVSQINNASFASSYVTKYISKSLAFNVPAHFRRVRASENWVKIPKPESVLSRLEWDYVGTNGALLSVYEECYRQKLSLVDVRTGELFEDEDLGTTIYA